MSHKTHFTACVIDTLNGVAGGREGSTKRDDNGVYNRAARGDYSRQGYNNYVASYKLPQLSRVWDKN